ncbi:hypothetical protein KDA00_05105 [Candidatus Saccharibacteria bacterium]|nr:hypothetical protein [Candidatus Saccharibacteria bacterium]
MNRIAKGIVSGAVGLAAVGAGFRIGEKPEITEVAIEMCQEALVGYPMDSKTLPKICEGPVTRAFDYTTENVMVKDGDGPAFPIEISRLVIPTPEEFKNRALKEKQDDENKVLPQHTASVIIGLGLGGVMYFEWAVNTAEYRAKKREKQE